MGVLTQIWEAIPVYTGLSPVTFFTVLALLWAGYYLLSGLFAPPPFKYEPMEPPPPPVQLGTISEEELKVYDGTDPKKPLLMAIRRAIFDVSQSRGFYGPGGPYSLFAGKDASRALAKMSFEDKDLTGDISGLNPSELEALNDWEYKFRSKYHQVGELPKLEGDPTEEAPREVLSKELPESTVDAETKEEAAEAKAEE